MFLSMLRKSWSQKVIFLDITIRPNYLEKKLQKIFFLFSSKSRKAPIINTRTTDFGQTLHVLDQKIALFDLRAQIGLFYFLTGDI